MVVKKTPHILLLGGGYTLQRLAARLDADSFVITSRNAAQCDEWRSDGLHAYQTSLEDKASLVALFAKYPNIQVIVDSVPPLRTDLDPAAGVKNVVDVIRSVPSVKRIIYLSTTGVFGVRDGSIVTEDTAPRPWNSQGEARLLSEGAYRASGREVVALRLPAIYGPDRGVHISLRQGSYRLVGDGTMWTNRIHVHDLVTVIHTLLLAPRVPPVLCVTDDAPTQAVEVVKYVCEREGLPLPSRVSEEEVLRHGAYTMLSNQRVMNDMMKKLLGVQLRYPTFKEGFYS